MNQVLVWKPVPVHEFKDKTNPKNTDILRTHHLSEQQDIGMIAITFRLQNDLAIKLKYYRNYSLFLLSTQILGSQDFSTFRDFFNLLCHETLCMHLILYHNLIYRFLYSTIGREAIITDIELREWWDLTRIRLHFVISWLQYMQ